MEIKDFFSKLPNKVNPDVLEGLASLFHFDFSDAGQYTVEVKDGKLDIREGLDGESKCKVATSAENFQKLIKGDLNPMMAMMTGKLKISNPGEMMKFAKIFGLM